MTVEIDFPTDEEAANALEEATDISLVYMRFELVVDGESVLTEISGGRYFPDWFYMFLIVCLDILPSLGDGGNDQFELEGSIELQFESDGETVTTYITEHPHDAPFGDYYEMDLQAFAREVIETSEEFLDFALDVRLDQREKPPAEEFEEALHHARSWYRETYGDDV